MDDLIDSVARAAGLPPATAAVAVAATLRFFTARLPSALVGELHAYLGERSSPIEPALRARSGEDA